MLNNKPSIFKICYARTGCQEHQQNEKRTADVQRRSSHSDLSVSEHCFEPGLCQHFGSSSSFLKQAVLELDGVALPYKTNKGRLYDQQTTNTLCIMQAEGKS